MNSLKIKNLSFSYTKDNKTIDNFSLEIERGSYVALLGHNGCGKSTLARILVGLLPFKEGEIYISDVQLTRENHNSIRNKVSIVFQNPDNQFIGATVEDDIAFSLENRNVPRDEMLKKVKEYAEKVGMKDFLNKEPAFLSGGQKQRVAIADALVINPEILILDEATSMLDPEGKKEILQVISNMRKENPDLIILTITHDVEEANRCDKVALMDKGKLIKFAKPDEIFNDDSIIEKYHLQRPFIYKMQKAMKEKGFKNVSTLEEMEESLCRLK
ncbi:MAG: energy-coupling factor transporter ATPase [Bacilli bacterium]|nr:energy-coupling factor transporter ATPase [Bacilli bacterium]